MIRVESVKKNARDEKIAYDLMPLRYGTPRHNEEFTRHDLWVSKSHPERPIEFLYAYLPNIVKDEENIEETDIVLWCNSASHHEPRHEDGMPNSAPRFWPGDDAWEGTALVMWSGFDLRPRNLFDRTPFYPYTPQPSPGRQPPRRGRCRGSQRTGTATTGYHSRPQTALHRKNADEPRYDAVSICNRIGRRGPPSYKSGGAGSVRRSLSTCLGSL